MTALEAHVRGYAFEKFLSDLFDAYGLDPKTLPLRDEQIDSIFSSTTKPTSSKPSGTASP